MKVLGPSVLLADSVERGPAQGGIAFAVGNAGVMVYAATGAEHRLAWVTRQGLATPLEAEPDAYRQPHLSPDGLQIAVSANDATRRPNMWLVDASDGRRQRLAGGAMMPAWSPDGRHVAVAGAGGPLMLLTPGGGAAQPAIEREPLQGALAQGTVPYPTAFSPDGRFLLVQANTQDVWRVSLAERRVEAVLTGPTNDWGAVVSPDGRAVAFTSDESGRSEVYVARWPGLEQRAAVSTRGGVYPRWSRDAHEIFFWQGRTMMAARVDHALRPAAAQPLFTGLYLGASSDPGFDVAPDGRFLVVQSDPRSALDTVTVLQHWAPLTAAR